jgi:hypothetical protein
MKLDLLADLQGAVRFQPATFAADVQHNRFHPAAVAIGQCRVDMSIHARSTLDMSRFTHTEPPDA